MRKKINILIIILLFQLSCAKKDYFQAGVDCYSKKDYKSAFKYWSKSAEEGNLEAKLKIACMYCKGRGLEMDFNKGFLMLQSMAEDGFAEAQYGYGLMHDFEGYGKNGKMYVLPDWDKAKYWYNKASAQGHPEAIQSLKEIEEKLKNKTHNEEAAGDGVPPPQR